MAHGTPDYAITNAAATIYRMNDLGELAVRLGSPVSYDRRGDVLFWDDFECGLGSWYSFSDGVGGAVAIDTTTPKNGSQCVKLTAGSDATHSAGIIRGLPYTVLAPFGVEASWAGETALGIIALIGSVYEGALFYQAAVRLDRNTGELQYADATGAWVTLETYVDYLGFEPVHNTFKVVWDPRDNTYVRVMLNERTIDLRGEGMPSFAAGGAIGIDVEVVNLGTAGANDVFYVDDVIVTQNEP